MFYSMHYFNKKKYFCTKILRFSLYGRYIRWKGGLGERKNNKKKYYERKNIVFSAYAMLRIGIRAIS